MDNEQLPDMLLTTGNEESKHVSIIPASSPITAPNIPQQVEGDNNSNKTHATSNISMPADTHSEILSWPVADFSTESFLDKVSGGRINTVIVSLKRQTYAAREKMSEFHGEQNAMLERAVAEEIASKY